jgi:hypothetical protein
MTTSSAALGERALDRLDDRQRRALRIGAAQGHQHARHAGRGAARRQIAEVGRSRA